MPRRHPHKPTGDYGNPFYGWLSVLVFGVFTLGILGSFWASRRGEKVRDEEMRKWKRWPVTQGTPSATRIIERPMFNPVYGTRVFRWYDGECRVEYSLAGKQYSLWSAASGDSDPKRLAEDMKTCPVSSFDVHYDPSHPADAHAFRERSSDR